MPKIKSKETIQLVSSKRKLPPDPEGLNDQRAASGKQIMDAYQELTGTDRRCSPGDLLSDLMHMCDRDPEFESFEDGLDRAERYYQSETSDPHVF